MFDNLINKAKSCGRKVLDTAARYGRKVKALFVGATVGGVVAAGAPNVMASTSVGVDSSVLTGEIAGTLTSGMTDVINSSLPLAFSILVIVAGTIFVWRLVKKG
ncbi:hypothetical protein HED60_23145 [Planctomycetales bacterium ZRK34]|nr:hypothetical protein HED60_23145 [Planctomycetales bacterium ZRK34]